MDWYWQGKIEVLGENPVLVPLSLRGAETNVVFLLVVR